MSYDYHCGGWEGLEELVRAAKDYVVVEQHDGNRIRPALFIGTKYGAAFYGPERFNGIKDKDAFVRAAKLLCALDQARDVVFVAEAQCSFSTQLLNLRISKGIVNSAHAEEALILWAECRKGVKQFIYPIVRNEEGQDLVSRWHFEMCRERRIWERPLLLAPNPIAPWEIRGMEQELNEIGFILDNNNESERIFTRNIAR